MTQQSFEQALAFGEDGEKQVAEYLLQKGASIIPFYQFDPNAAPYLLFGGKKYILPDLFCTKNKEAFFVECKRKNRWVSFKGRVETGFTDRLLQDYKAIQEITGIHIYTCFIMQNKAENKYNDALPPDGLYVLRDLNISGRLWDGTNGRGVFIQPPIYLWECQSLTFIEEFKDTHEIDPN